MLFDIVIAEAMVIFTELTVVAKIVYNICDKSIQLKGKQVIDHADVFSLIIELQLTIQWESETSTAPLPV